MRRSIFSVVLFALVLIFTLSFSSVLYAQEEEAGYQFTAKDKVILTQPSICYVTTYYYAFVYDPNSESWSEQYYYGPLGGTGFVVNPDTGHIVTAAHVVEEDYVDIKWAILDAYIYNTYPDDYNNLTDSDWNWLYDEFKVEGQNKTEPDREVWVQFNTATAGLPDSRDSAYMRAEVIDSSPWEQRDIAVLKIQPITGRALSSTILGDSSKLEIQDSLTIIGYPWNADISAESILTPSITSGIISARKMVSGTEVLQIDGTAAPGNSGGPVLNEDGEAIGILTMAISGENINYLRPSNDIKEMLARNGVENKLGITDENFAKGLAMYRQSHYTEAIKYFDAVLNLSQGHLLAQEYKANAQAAINRGEDVPLGAEATPPEATDEEEGSFALGVTFIVLMIIVPLIVIAGIIVLVVFLVRRKKPETKAAEPSEIKHKVEEAHEKYETEETPEEHETEKEPKKEIRFCPSCGKEVEEGEKFCSNCGNRIE